MLLVVIDLKHAKPSVWSLRVMLLCLLIFSNNKVSGNQQLHKRNQHINTRSCLLQGARCRKRVQKERADELFFHLPEKLNAMGLSLLKVKMSSLLAILKRTCDRFVVEK